MEGWWKCLCDRWRCVGDGKCAHVLSDAYICVAYVLCTSPCYVDPSSSFTPPLHILHPSPPGHSVGCQEGIGQHPSDLCAIYHICLT